MLVASALVNPMMLVNSIVALVVGWLFVGGVAWEIPFIQNEKSISIFSCGRQK